MRLVQMSLVGWVLALGGCWDKNDEASEASNTSWTDGCEDIEKARERVDEDDDDRDDDDREEDWEDDCDKDDWEDREDWEDWEDWDEEDWEDWEDEGSPEAECFELGAACVEAGVSNETCVALVEECLENIEARDCDDEFWECVDNGGELPVCMMVYEMCVDLDAL